MATNGYRKVTKLRKYVGGVATDVTKDNVKGTEEYIPPSFDLTNCPSTDSRAVEQTTSTTSTTSTTTSNLVDAVALVFCTGKEPDPCSRDLSDSETNIIYVKPRETPGSLASIVYSGINNIGGRNLKYVVDNSPINIEKLRILNEGYIYNRDEVNVLDGSVSFKDETIDAERSLGVGKYLISARSLLIPGELDGSEYTAENTPFIELVWDGEEQRLKYKFGNCARYDQTDEEEEVLGGGKQRNKDIQDIMNDY